MKLNKTDFNTLDKLLNKIGFGSYYDLIQMLKDTAYNIQPKLQDKLEKETDLLKIVNLISRLSRILNKENKKSYLTCCCGGIDFKLLREMLVLDDITSVWKCLKCGKIIEV